MKAFVIVCAFVVGTYAGIIRDKRGFFSNTGVSVSSGYGAGYTNYGDYSKYSTPRHLSPVSSWRSPPAYVYTPAIAEEPVNVRVVELPEVVRMREIVTVPQEESTREMVTLPQVDNAREIVSLPETTVNKMAAEARSSGYNGYGTGTTSGYFGYSRFTGYSRYSGYPGFSGYASSWW